MPGADSRTNQPGGRYLLLLSLTALGVVYGDIGTSPLYAVREAFHPSHQLAVTSKNVLGVLSLVFWSLTLIISIKYITLILRADNQGEGGILALTALVTPVVARRGSGRRLLILLGLFGTALLYGDGMITPAISVLSAVEGLEIATPFFRPYILPITVVILVLLFAFQKRGTAAVGKVFGIVMLFWFFTLAALGVWQIAKEPRVLLAVNPLYAVDFFVQNGFFGFLVLGSIFLVVTGGEALYADLGHFGRAPIRLAWFTLVLPSLLLNYFGQGALLLYQPEAAQNTFYHMVPSWALYPVVLLATAAAVIASQALITGAFSVTMQAIQLGYISRARIDHTSEQERGQIYIPSINWALMIACVGLVLGFGSSSNLAAAYGVAAITTMVITTLLFFVVLRERWKWSLPAALVVAGFFLFIDLSFWGSNLFKIPAGGWFPLLVGGLVFTLLSTWKKGRQLLGQRIQERSVPTEHFLEDIFQKQPHRVPGTAVFMYSNLRGTPLALLYSLEHYKVLHQRIIFLTVETEDVPRLPPEERVESRTLAEGFSQIVLHYGFMEEPDVPKALGGLVIDGQELNPEELSYFLGRERLLASAKPGMALWREKLFAAMTRNARSPTDFFRLPPDRVVELGAQIEI